MENFYEVFISNHDDCVIADVRTFASDQIILHRKYSSEANALTCIRRRFNIRPNHIYLRRKLGSGEFKSVDWM